MRRRTTSVVIALLVCASLAAAQGTDTAPDAFDATRNKLRGDIDGGAVINQTITVAGQDFFQYFTEIWRDKQGSDRHILVIRERPSARAGTQIWIEFGNKRAFQSVIPPRRAAIKPISQQAVEQVYQVVIDAQLSSLQSRDPDIAPDEF